MREYQIDKAKLDIADALNQREQQKQIRNAMTETSHILTESYQNGWWATPEGLNKIGEGLARIQARIPAVAETDTFKGMWGTLIQRRNQLDIGSRDSDTPQEKNLAKAQEYENQAAVAREKNDIPTAQRLERDAKLLRSAVGGRRSSTRAFSPTGEKLFEITEGPEEPGGVTPSTQSQLERRALTYGNSIAGINEVMRKVRPEHVGVQGWLGEFVVDRGLAQVFPELADKERIDSRSLLEVMKASLVRQISEDPESRFSNEDRREITGLINGISPTMSYPQLIGAFERVRETMKDRIRSYSERTGEPIPASVKTREELLSDYDKQLSAIRKSATNRQITPEQMRVEMETAKQRIAETLRRFHGVIVEFGAPQPVAP